MCYYLEITKESIVNGKIRINVTLNPIILFDGGTNIELIKELLFLVGQLRVGNRTRRVEPRVIKRRPKAYSMMVKPRPILRQEIVQSWA